MENETKDEIEKELREDDFIFGDYIQSVNPRRRIFAEVYGNEESAQPSTPTTQPQSAQPSTPTTQPQSKKPKPKN
ncbi:MAG: hypothetical protein WBA22_04610 [Candidatus Methanofastidiosia archaeon]